MNNTKLHAVNLKTLYFKIVIVIFLLCPSISSANLTDVQIYYINGINTNVAMAASSAHKLSRELGIPSTQVRGLYNSTNVLPRPLNIAPDLLESQAMLEAADNEGVPVWRYFWSVLLGYYIPPLGVADLINNLVRDTNEGFPLSAQRDRDSMVQLINQGYTMKGVNYPGRNNVLDQKSILVGHSQGSVFTNFVYEDLEETASIAEFSLHTHTGYPSETSNCTGVMHVASIATNANPVANNGSYVTGVNDEVINYVRALHPDTLPAKSPSIKNFVLDPLGHSFRDVYLTQPNLRNTVVSFINLLGVERQDRCKCNYVLTERSSFKVHQHSIRELTGATQFKLKLSPFFYGPHPNMTTRTFLRVIDENDSYLLVDRTLSNNSYSHYFDFTIDPNVYETNTIDIFGQPTYQVEVRNWHKGTFNDGTFRRNWINTIGFDSCIYCGNNESGCGF